MASFGLWHFLAFDFFWPLAPFGLWHLLGFWPIFWTSHGGCLGEMAAPCFLVIKAVGVVEMLKIYIFTEEGNELELETNVSK